MIAALFASALALFQIAPPSLADDLAHFQSGLRACGVTALPEFTEESPQTREYWLTLSGAQVTEAGARCLAGSPALDSLIINFTDPATAAAFAVVRAARPDVKAAYEESLRGQSEWLAERGLLEHRPRLAMDQPLSVFAVAAERHCGLARGAMLRANDDARSLTLVGDSHPSFEQFRCVFGVISLGIADASPEVAVVIEGEDAAE